jgi:hypothetical protein
MRSRTQFALAAGLLMAAGLAQAGAVRTDNEPLFRPTGKGFGEVDADADAGAGVAARAAVARARTNRNVITLHSGGSVMNNVAGTNVYYIWYGNWAGNTATTILTDLAGSIGGSPYFNINTTYYDTLSGSKKYVTNAVHYLGSTTDNYSAGKALSDAQIQTVVSSAITSGRLPKDANGVYFVLTSADVNASSGFCSQYCGWHTKATIGGSIIKYAFVGNPDRCPTSCAAQTTGPNGNAGADGVASIIAHELEETVSDPQLNAWYDGTGAENADKCAWTFGTQSTAANGAKYNMTLGSRPFLIQQNWVNKDAVSTQYPNAGYCAVAY